MRIGVALILAMSLAGSAQAETNTSPTTGGVATIVVAPLPAGAKARPVALTRLASELTPGQEIGIGRFGAVCVQPFPIYWKNVSGGFANLGAIFGEELEKAGFKPSTAPGDLFAAKETAATDLEIGAMIKGADASYCQSLLHITQGLKLDIEWQLYSNLRREVVATIETQATTERVRRTGDRDAPRPLGQDAFAANVRALLNDERFRNVVTAADPGVAGAPTLTTGHDPIQLQGAGRGSVQISDAVGSVASIFAGDGMGSGVLISTDGYMLTDQHVVGTAQHVRVRWSDGFETTGDVVRSDKRRDVAVIKTDTHGRQPLPIRRGSPQIGASVYAIGTPLDPKLQSTVTKGIVSANRIVDGFSFIQSDVPVNHGNSGGPLLDESGAVIGLTDWGLQPAGDNNHNFFTPVGDALDFLGLKVAEAAAAPTASRPPARKAARRK